VTLVGCCPQRDLPACRAAARGLPPTRHHVPPAVVNEPGCRADPSRPAITSTRADRRRPFSVAARSTFPRLAGLTARARSAASTPPTRSRSTRRARTRSSPRVSGVTTGSSPVTEDRRSPSSTRRPRRPRRSSCGSVRALLLLCASERKVGFVSKPADSSLRCCVSPFPRVLRLQGQAPDGPQALQALRARR
jgi:hypothetical protein